MALDTRKNKDSIISAWKDISNTSSNNTWAIFGYEGQTSVLKLVETGDGDFEEMVDSLNSGKIQYAYCRVTDPNTNLPKFVLVNWQGDGAPDTLKGRCANHVRDVASLLRGAHLTINARDESDLDMDDVLKQVAKSSGANYSIHKEKPKKMEESSGPIGSVYKKTKPQAEIKIDERDKFWEQTEMEEKRRKEAEIEEKKRTQQKLEQERRQREADETRERERRIHDHAKQVQQQRAAEAAATRASAPKPTNRQKDVDDDEEERRTRSESLRKQRAAEAAQLVKQRENNPKEMFKQRERAASQDESAAPLVAPKKVVKPFPAQPPPQPTRRQPSPPREPSPPPREPSPPPREQSPPPREPSPPPREPSPPPREPSPPPREPSPTPVRQPPSTMLSMMTQGLPHRQDYDEEEEEQDWDTPVLEDFEPPNVEPYQQIGQDENAGMDDGIKARAIYDYQATADDEISFDPGDLITDIEKVDDGWWIGVAPDGHKGLFPANYVELI